MIRIAGWLRDNILARCSDGVPPLGPGLNNHKICRTGMDRLPNGSLACRWKLQLGRKRSFKQTSLAGVVGNVVVDESQLIGALTESPRISFDASILAWCVRILLIGFAFKKKFRNTLFVERVHVRFHDQN